VKEMRDKMECPACMKWTWADALACEWCGGSLPPIEPFVIRHHYAEKPIAIMSTASDCGGVSPREFLLSAQEGMGKAARLSLERALGG
jgi:hypothetical protein